jgi:hypothetical protein
MNNKFNISGLSSISKADLSMKTADGKKIFNPLFVTLLFLKQCDDKKGIL